MLVFCLVVALSAPAPATAPAAGRSQIRTGWMGGAVCQLERRGRHQAKTSNSGAHLVARNAGFVLGMALPFKFGAPEKKYQRWVSSARADSSYQTLTPQ